MAARSLLAALKSGPLSTAELDAVCDVGGPYVANLLEALEQAGLVGRMDC